MNKNKEFINNTIILLIGKFATQFVTFLLIPLYTHYLITEDYGIVDLMQTYINLFVPVLILRFDSAVFRFLIDERKKFNNEEGKSTVITNVIITILCVTSIFILIYLIVGIFVCIRYFWLLLFTVISIMFSNILLQISRGLGKNKEYSIACILTAEITLVLNVILIIKFNVGASSILISTCVANFLCSIYIFIKNGTLKFINIKYINRNKIVEYLKYSLPMIPNSLSWWIVNVSDRSIIAFVLGAAMNGIYTISCKFSNIINSIFTIFNMSWQESASIHIDDEDKDVFFTNIISKMLDLFSTVSLAIIAILPLVYNWVVGSDYISSYTYIPILIFANIFNIAINLFGAIYIAKKETKKIMNTTIISAAINFILNIAFIKYIGLYAACLSTLFAYLIMALYRYRDIQKYVHVSIKSSFILRVVLGFVIASVFYYINALPFNLLNILFVAIYVLIFNRKTFSSILKIIKRDKKQTT